jgi:hypothetical protein
VSSTASRAEISRGSMVVSGWMDRGKRCFSVRRVAPPTRRGITAVPRVSAVSISRGTQSPARRSSCANAAPSGNRSSQTALERVATGVPCEPRTPIAGRRRTFPAIVAAPNFRTLRRLTIRLSASGTLLPSPGGAGLGTPTGRVRLFLEMCGGDERPPQVNRVVNDRHHHEPGVAVRLGEQVVVLT